MSDIHDYAYRFRGVLMVPIYLMLVLLFVGETERDGVVWPLGLALFATGVSIRVWAQMHLHYRLRVHKYLTLTGPYLYVRNPIYIGNTIMLLGLTVVSELLWALPLMLAWCVFVYRNVVRREERHLTEKYGEPYVHFLGSVPRWVPRVPAIKPIVGSMRSFLLPSLLAESHCLLFLIPLIAKEVLSGMFE